jgi:hypothetical protein
MNTHPHPPKRWGDMHVKEFAAVHPYIFWGWLALFIGVNGYNLKGIRDKYREYLTLKEDAKHLEQMYAKRGSSVYVSTKDGETEAS